MSTTAMSRAAELFVTDRATNRVLSFDEETGDFLRVVTATGLDVPSGMTFGPAGFLYVTNVQGGPFGTVASVVRVDPVDGTTTPFITDVIGAGGISYHAPSNTFFVSEFAQMGVSDGNEVHRFDASGNLLQTIGTGSAATGRAGMTFDDDGNLYVSETNYFGAVGSVLKYAAPEGNPLDDYATAATTFASGAIVSLALPYPPSGFNGLTFDDNGNLFVASLTGQAFVKFLVSGGEVVQGLQFGEHVPYPSGVLIGGDGNILVSSLGNDRLTDPFYPNQLFPGNITRYNDFFFATSPFLVGDANGDTVVDDADLAILQDAYGTPYNTLANADFDGDFDTDGRDFLAWQRGFGNSGISGAFQPTAMASYLPLAAAISIPEPSTLALLSLALCAMSRQRKPADFST
ncbi:MAG: PEP-CTERM sorting domain-containing protein [Bythopirellula sp.]|nr:PEP-CTERM sorting domain-containing protein [Bythopirellula sp.]